MNYVSFMAMIALFGTIDGLVFQVRDDVPEYNNLIYGYSSHRCHVIPDSFTLCKNIGYTKMILPNFLQHETISEAVSSSNDWQKLTEFNCHNDTRRFLCSLYAPVCVPNEAIRKIQPCRELCLSVKKSCFSPMQTFGYKWPDILHCDKFPQKNAGLCIRGTEGKVLKVKISKIVSITNSKTILRLHRKSKILKAKFSDIPFLPSVDIECNCSQMSTMNLREGRWLLMGVVKDRQFKLSSLTKWKKKKKNFKQLIRRLKKNEQKMCGEKYQASQKQITGLNIYGQKMKAKKNKRMSRKME